MGQYEYALETVAERMFTRRQALLLGEGAKYYSVSGGASNTSGWNFDAKACGCGTRQANHGPCLPECSGSHHRSFKRRRWSDGVGRQYGHPACYYLALYLREC